MCLAIACHLLSLFINACSISRRAVASDANRARQKAALIPSAAMDKLRTRTLSQLLYIAHAHILHHITNSCITRCQKTTATTLATETHSSLTPSPPIQSLHTHCELHTHIQLQTHTRSRSQHTHTHTHTRPSSSTCRGGSSSECVRECVRERERERESYVCAITSFLRRLRSRSSCSGIHAT